MMVADLIMTRRHQWASARYPLSELTPDIHVPSPPWPCYRSSSVSSSRAARFTCKEVVSSLAHAAAEGAGRVAGVKDHKLPYLECAESGILGCLALFAARTREAPVVTVVVSPSSLSLSALSLSSPPSSRAATTAVRHLLFRSFLPSLKHLLRLLCVSLKLT